MPFGHYWKRVRCISLWIFRIRTTAWKGHHLSPWPSACLRRILGCIFRAILALLRWECLEKPLRMQFAVLLVRLGGAREGLQWRWSVRPVCFRCLCLLPTGSPCFCRWPTPVRFLSFCRSSPRSRESYSGRISFRDFPVWCLCRYWLSSK